jgi:hypothetical protein
MISERRVEVFEVQSSATLLLPAVGYSVKSLFRG